MKLVSLSLRQWRSYESCDLEFPDGLIGVRGSNGSGKTTIAEAVGWALFGKLRSGARVGDLKRQDADGQRSLVELVFRLGATVYRVERVVGGSAKLWIGDGDDPETTQTRATNERIVQELGIGWDAFQRTVFARQKDVAALDPGATSENRIRHVERLLGLERYREAATRAGTRKRELESELVGMREQAPDLGALRLELEEAKEAAAGGNPAVAAAIVALEEARGGEAALEDRVEAERERTIVHDRLTAEREAVSSEVEALDTDLESLRERVAERAESAARVAELVETDDALAEASWLRQAWERLNECHGELAALDPADEIDRGEAAERAERRDRLRAELEDLRSQALPALDGLRARVHALEAAAGVPPHEDARDRLERLNNDRDELRDEIAARRAALADDETHLAEVERGGAGVACRMCLRPYGDDYDEILAMHRERLATGREELAALEQRCTQLEAERAEASAVCERARDATQQLERTSGAPTLDGARRVLADAEEAVRSTTARIDELKATLTELDAQVAADVKATSENEAKRARWEVANERFSEAAREIGVATFAETEFRRVVEQHEVASARAVERAELVTTLKATEGLPDELAKLEQRRTSKRERLEAAEAELDELSFDPERLGALRAELQTAKEATLQAREVLGEAKLVAQSSDQTVAERQQRVEEAEAAHAALAAHEQLARQHAVAVTLLREFRAAQHERAWPKLESGAGELLSTTTDGRYADVRLTNDYKLEIVDRGERHGLERYSGGEQDLANLCLRLAIADWVARERDVELGVVVLDEVFGSQDEDRRRRLLEALRSLDNRFNQLMVITHLTDIAELCDHQLSVSLDAPGRSSAQFAD